MTTRLDPTIRAGWIAFNRDLEGEVLTMYLDIRRLVTVAHGVLIDPIGAAYSLPWVSAATGLPATRAEVTAEWQRVKTAWDSIPADATPAKIAEAKGAIWVAQTRGKGSLVRLTHEGMVTTTLDRFDDQERDLLRRYPALPSWPVEAQTVCMSIAWAAGTAAAFPKMYAAMHRGDWLTAADECYLRVDNPDGFRNIGLIPRNRHNRALLLALAKRDLYAEHGRLADALFTGGLDEAGRERLGMVRALLDVFQVAEAAGKEIPKPFPWPAVEPPAEDRPSSPPVVIVEDEAVPDTDPMTDQQRREVLALIHATAEASLAEDRAEAYRRR